MSLSPVPAPRPDHLWLTRAVALLVLSCGAGAVTAIAPALVTVAHASDDSEQARSDDKADEAAEEQVQERDPEHAAAPVPLPAEMAQAPAPTVTRGAAALVPARPAAEPIKAGTTTTTTTTTGATTATGATAATTTTAPAPARARVAAAAPPGPQADRAPAQKPSTPISAPQAALPSLALAAETSPARPAEEQVASAAPSVVGETVGRVLYVGGAGLLLLLALYGAAYRGARSLRLPGA